MAPARMPASASWRARGNWFQRSMTGANGPMHPPPCLRTLAKSRQHRGYGQPVAWTYWRNPDSVVREARRWLLTAGEHVVEALDVRFDDAVRFGDFHPEPLDDRAGLDPDAPGVERPGGHGHLLLPLDQDLDVENSAGTGID